MVKFKSISIQNFMSYKEAHLELDNQGLVLITGENKSNDSFQRNGNGKSSILSAITYALYGKTERGLKADDVVNNQEKKNTFVKLTFYVKEDKYTIERYRKHREFKNKVKLLLNDKDITGSTNDVTDKKIQELFGIEFNTYVNAIMYGSGETPMFSQATDKGKKEILDSITKVDVYKKAQDIAKLKIDEVTKEQEKLESEVDKAQYKKELVINQYKEEVDKYNKLLEQKEREEKELEDKRAEYNNKVESISNQIRELQNSIPSVEGQDYVFCDDYSTWINTIEKLKEAILGHFTPKKQEVRDIQRDNQYKVSSLRESLNNLDTSDHCPVCGSAIDNSHKVAETQRIKEEIANIEKNNQLYVNAEKVIQDKIDTVQNEVDRLYALVEQEDKNKEQHDNKIREQLSNQQRYYSKITELQNEKASIKEPQVRDYSSFLIKPDKNKLDSIIEDLDNTIDRIKNDVLELETKKGKYKQAVDAFGNKGIRSVVLDFITPFLNEKANYYLQTLSGSDISIEFQTQVKNNKGELKDKFDVIVDNKNGGDNYKANSKGEQRRIDLAISFAIQDLIMSKEDLSTNIALYDEVFDGLDTIGCENVIKLLKERLEDIGTIFVITHNLELQSLFEKTLHVVKEDGISRIERN